MSATAVPAMADDTFLATWRALPTADRRRVRRLMRIGRVESGSPDEQMAVALARYQQARPWWRLFWLWFVPGLVLVLGTASQIHPLVVGVVLAMAAQALLTRRNVRRLARGT